MRSALSSGEPGRSRFAFLPAPQKAPADYSPCGRNPAAPEQS